MGDYKRVPIPGYEGLYDVDTNGDVYSYYKGRKLAQHDKSKTYVQVALCKNGKIVRKNVHRLVATMFVKNPKPHIYTQVNHIDGNKKNNHAENLEWVTASENVRHAHITGLVKDPTHKCVDCGKEFKRNFEPIYPFNRCPKCRDIYRATLPRAKENMARQKRIISRLKELGISQSEIRTVIGKSESAVYMWFHGHSNWKPSELDVIERELLEVW